MRTRTVTVLAAALILVAAIVAVVLVTITGASETAIIGFLSTVVIPSAISLVALSRGESTAEKVKDTANTVDQVADNVQTVKAQTNGALTRILDRLDALECERAATVGTHGDIPQQGQETGPAGAGSAAGGS